MSVASVIATISVITYVTPIFLVVAVPLTILYIIIQVSLNAIISLIYPNK